MSSNQNNSDRLRLIKLIHVAKRELAMDDETYRTMLAHMPELRGKTSSADCNLYQLEAIVKALKSKGFRVRHARINRPKPAQSRPLAADAQSRKIRSLWLELHDLGAVRDPSEKALAEFVRKATGRNALQWISSDQARRVIEQLKKWRQREEKKHE